jgi:hypothetical protein
MTGRRHRGFTAKILLFLVHQVTAILVGGF